MMSECSARPFLWMACRNVDDFTAVCRETPKHLARELQGERAVFVQERKGGGGVGGYGVPLALRTLHGHICCSFLGSYAVRS